MKRFALSVGIMMAVIAQASADQEKHNDPVVVASETGYCYAKSVPDEDYGERGTTQIFRVEKAADKVVQTYKWYARQLYIDCLWPFDSRPRISVVQIGPWARGRTASPDVLAIAFYLDGRLLKRYSTLDIAGTPANVNASVHHYVVFEKVDGYRWGAGFQRFVVHTIDGRTLVFDSETGERVRDKVIEGPPN